MVSYLGKYREGVVFCFYDSETGKFYWKLEMKNRMMSLFPMAQLKTVIS